MFPQDFPSARDGDDNNFSSLVIILYIRTTSEYFSQGGHGTTDKQCKRNVVQGHLLKVLVLAMLGNVQAALADPRSCYNNEYSIISFCYIYEFFFIFF